MHWLASISKTRPQFLPTHSHPAEMSRLLKEIKLHRAKNRHIALIFTLLTLRKRRPVRTDAEQELDCNGYDESRRRDRGWPSLIRSVLIRSGKPWSWQRRRRYSGGWVPHANASKSPGRNQTSVRSGLEPQFDVELQRYSYFSVGYPLCPRRPGRVWLVGTDWKTQRKTFTCQLLKQNHSFSCIGSD